MTHFPVSGIDTYWWLPVVIAFAISAFTSTGGLSGAFLLLPFQVSVLGFTGPAVSSTNLVFNIVAIPSGVYRYWKERRMVWPLVWTVILGTLPGVFVGAIIRIKLFSNPSVFKLFAGLVLLYLGIRLLIDVIRRKTAQGNSSANGGSFIVRQLEFNTKRIGYEFNGEEHFASSRGLFVLALIVGIVGGAYGIGGGAIIAPFLVAVFGLPVYTVAGAALMGTCVTSIVGVMYYTIIARFYADTGIAIAPDWALGALFGVGGAAGMYVGARMQRYMPARIIKIIISACLLFVSVKYIVGFFV